MSVCVATVGTAVYRLAGDQKMLSAKLKEGKKEIPGHSLQYGNTVSGDGNCLFRSIVELLSSRGDPPRSHLQVRREIVDHVISHPHRFLHDVDANDDESLAKYAARMWDDASGRGDDGWGGPVEIEAAADLYGFVVRVWTLKDEDLGQISDKAELQATFFPCQLDYKQLPKMTGYPMNELHLVNTMYDVPARSHYEPARLVPSDSQRQTPELLDLGALKERRARGEQSQQASALEQARAVWRSRQKEQAVLNDRSIKDSQFEPKGQATPSDPSDAASATLREAVDELTTVLRGLEADDSENREIIKNRIRHLEDLMPRKTP